MKDPEPLEDWEKQLHRELSELPELQAPSTLIPGVLSRIGRPAAVAWYHSSWWQWPLAMRWASAALVVAVLGTLGWLGGALDQLQFGQHLVEAYTEMKGAMAFGVQTCTKLLGSSAVFWSEYGQMILLAAAALLFATYLTCIAAGTALYQLAWRRSS